MARTTEPEYLQKWREMHRIPIPKCCHTCFDYTPDGKCERYDTEPPAEFTAQRDACPDWNEDVPF